MSCPFHIGSRFCGCLRLACLFFAFWLLAAPDASAQFATVRGRVTDAADDQPLPGAAVLVESLDDGRQLGTAADEGGYYILSRIPPGAYLLRTRFIGYAEAVDTLTLDFNEVHTYNTRLESDAVVAGEVVVESERQADGRREMAGFESIRPAALARVPMPGVSGDLASYLQTLPGVTVQGDRGGQLFIRGGTPTQNLVLIDGIPIFQPFHIVGFYSAFPADIVAFADVYTSGFGARYGGRLSSVIDVSTRNGNKRRVTAGASIAPFLSTARLEVPLYPERFSLLASFRESVIEHLAPDVLGDELPYRFGDRFVKLHGFLTRTSSFALIGLQTFDRGDVAATGGASNEASNETSNELRWENQAYGGHYTYLPTDFPAIAQVRFFMSTLDSHYRSFGEPSRDAQARTGGLEAKFIYYLGPSELHAGLFARSYGFSSDLGGPDGPQEEFISEGGLYVDLGVDASEAWRIEPGLRLHTFPARSRIVMEPRLRAAWRPEGREGKHTFSAAWGLYHQEIIGLFNARDVTDAFVAWAPSPAGSDIPTAMHLLGGWSGLVAPGITLNVEAYYKHLDHLSFVEYRAGEQAGLITDPVKGYATGADLRLEWVRPSSYLAINYGLGSVLYQSQGERVLREAVPLPDGTFVARTRREPIDARFRPPHDRRHQVNVLGRLARGPYALNLQWQFGSGLPYTRTQGFYEELIVTLDDAHHTQPGTTQVIQTDNLYQARLPAYHRLDVSAQRRFEGRHVAAVLQAGAINLYNRANLFDIDLLTGQRIDQLPFIPSVGLKVEVK